jgi:hypothetical protein
MMRERGNMIAELEAARGGKTLFRRSTVQGLGSSGRRGGSVVTMRRGI